MERTLFEQIAAMLTLIVTVLLLVASFPIIIREVRSWLRYRREVK